MTTGTVVTVAFSPDQEQKFLYVTSGDQKIRIYDVGLEENINGDSYGEPVKYRRGDIVSPHVAVHEHTVDLLGERKAHGQGYPAGPIAALAAGTSRVQVW